MSRIGKCSYKDVCELYLPKGYCVEDNKYAFCGLYLRRQRERSARALENFASCGCDSTTLQRLRGVNTHAN